MAGWRYRCDGASDSQLSDTIGKAVGLRLPCFKNPVKLIVSDSGSKKEGRFTGVQTSGVGTTVLSTASGGTPAISVGGGRQPPRRGRYHP